MVVLVVAADVVVSTTGSRSWLSSLHVNATNTHSKLPQSLFCVSSSVEWSLFPLPAPAPPVTPQVRMQSSRYASQDYSRRNISPLAS